LEAVLAEHVEHYNGHRPHRSLELRPPLGPTVLPAVAGGHVVRGTRVHGLINEYSRQAVGGRSKQEAACAEPASRRISRSATSSAPGASIRTTSAWRWRNSTGLGRQVPITK